MRIDNGQWVCTSCGEIVDLSVESPWHAEPGADGDEPNVRVVFADGHEVHRCEVAPTAA